VLAREFRKLIAEKLPEGSVVTAHTADAHFYRVVAANATLPSVTGKLQHLKDEGLSNWKRDQALEYIFEHWQELSWENLQEHLTKAKNKAGDIFEDAGDVGTRIHGYREDYFRDWIANDARPIKRPVEYIPPTDIDVRCISAMNALEKFVDDYEYEPVATELSVYDLKLGIGGQLDDIGLAWFVTTRGETKDGHLHDLMTNLEGGLKWCVTCPFMKSKELVLLDLKSSNRFKDSYFFQVGLYYHMFYTITGIKPGKFLILKVAKENSQYAIEELTDLRRIISYAKHVVKSAEGIEFVKILRKIKQPHVAKPLQL